MNDFFNSIVTVGEGLTLTDYLTALGASLLCGIIVLLATSFRNNVTKSFAVTVLLLPAIVQTVIVMVNGNVGTGIAVAGAFSLVRFRSVPGKAREIASIFLAMTAGLASAAGYVGIALLFTVVISLINSCESARESATAFSKSEFAAVFKIPLFNFPIFEKAKK